jgi:hypothetical protein
VGWLAVPTRRELERRRSSLGLMSVEGGGRVQAGRHKLGGKTTAGAGGCEE